MRALRAARTSDHFPRNALTLSVAGAKQMRRKPYRHLTPIEQNALAHSPSAFRPPDHVPFCHGRLFQHLDRPLFGVAAMKAHQLINGVGASYGPETLKVIIKAFDDAWDEIAPCFSRSGLQAQSVRLTLANAILEVAREDSRDSDELKNAGLQAMALAYRADPKGLPGYLSMREATDDRYGRRY
jgi:hypothetical protein